VSQWHQRHRSAEAETVIQKHAQMIFNNLYRASVMYRDTLSPDYIRIFGMPTVGDPVFDRQMSTEQIDTWLTIDQMVEYFRKGVVVSLLDHQDSKRIYDIVEQYLRAWKQDLEVGINIGDAPIKDLIDLDRFANTVFSHAAQYMGVTYFSSEFVNALTNNGTLMNRDSLFKAPVPVEKDTGEPEVRKRQSMLQIFQERIVTGTQRVDPAVVQETSTALPRWQRKRG